MLYNLKSGTSVTLAPVGGVHKFRTQVIDYLFLSSQIFGFLLV